MSSQAPIAWPSALWLVRHGESAGNIARDQATAAGVERIEIGERDVDVPLSELGHQQARALADWLGMMPSGECPQCVLSSPYLRAVQTAAPIQRAVCRAPATAKLILDERLREKEFGTWNRLTTVGVRQLFPDQAEVRRAVGKFYHRPPGGESWCDVILRLRSMLNTLSLHYAGQRVLIVAHQVVVMCFRYLLENLDEAEILAIDADGDIANCGVTRYRYQASSAESGSMVLEAYNWTVPLEQEGAPVTLEPRTADTPR